MPQKPYIPLGTLRRAATYPRAPEDFDEKDITDTLEMVGLAHLNEKLDDEEQAWDRTLSGGEQQRLAFARLFLHEPDIVVMDEATSALDPESQAMLMEKLAEHLPKTAIISVGHRPELEAFHERKVNLVRREGGAKLVPGEMVGAADQRDHDADEALARTAGGRDDRCGYEAIARALISPSCSMLPRNRRAEGQTHSASSRSSSGRLSPLAASIRSRTSCAAPPTDASRPAAEAARTSSSVAARISSASAAESRARSTCGRQSFIANSPARPQRNSARRIRLRAVSYSTSDKP